MELCSHFICQILDMGFITLKLCTIGINILELSAYTVGRDWISPGGRGSRLQSPWIIRWVTSAILGNPFANVADNFRYFSALRSLSFFWTGFG